MQTAQKEETSGSGTQLIEIEKLNPKEVFSPGGLDPILERIERDALSIARDISTAQGRDNVRTIAHRVAKSKTALDKMGKELGEGLREELNKINSERKRGVERLQSLQDEIRAPLTEFENAEKERISAHESAISSMKELATFHDVPTAGAVQSRLETLPRLFQRDWQEFSERAKKEHEFIQNALNEKLSERKRYEDEQAELARLRAEEEARKQKEREKQIAAEAAAKARKEAEENAAAEADRQAKLAEQARREVIRQKEEAERKAAEAEARRRADAEAAAKAEREKIAAEKFAEEKAAAERQADKEHRAKINNEALKIMVEIMTGCNGENDCAKQVLTAIVQGKVPHVSIKY